MKRIIFSLFVGATAALSTLPVAQAAKAPVQTVADAPSTYTVVRGDTLWSIAGRFIKDPWRWPDVWRLNREQIRNPHLIYPGQVVMFDGQYLTIGKPVGERRDIQPTIYIDRANAIPTVPMSIITPFLTRPLVVDDKTMRESHTVVALDQQRVLAGVGSTIFADGITEDHQLGWEIFRPAKPVYDLDGKTLLGYEAEHVGEAALQAPSKTPNEPATLAVTSVTSEIRTGDRILPRRVPDVFSYAPHAPEQDVNANIVGIYRGVYTAGRYNVVTLNQGSDAGLEPGTVLAIYRERGSVRYAENVDDKGKVYNLPSARIGLAMVFRVFDRISYALIMDADGDVKIGDHLSNP